MRPVFRLEPSIYRSVIDEVVAAIKPEFDEYGVSEDVLAELQHVSRLFFSLLTDLAERAWIGP